MISEKDISDSQLPREVVLPLLKASGGLYRVDVKEMPAALAVARRLISNEPSSGEVARNMASEPLTLSELAALRRQR